MPACASCGHVLAPEASFCSACGAAAREGVARPKIFLEDLYHHCERCSREEVYGRLTKCAACADRVCGECARRCDECGEPTCLKCVLECAECRKTGCVRCLERCEACLSRALCGEHALGCEDCGLATCESCMRYCERCSLEVCQVCMDEAHEKRARKHS